MILMINRTALHLAVEKENIDIVKLLLSKYEIDVNITCITKYPIFLYN